MSHGIVRLVTGGVVGTAALLALRWASLAPLADDRGDRAWIRLSWSARPERIEQCRRRSDAEMAELPEHMRLRLECTGHFARYLLQLSVDGTIVQSDTVRGGGFRHDRPMHVLDQAPVDAGDRRVTVVLSRLDSTATPADSDRVQPAPERQAGGDREARERDERLRRTEESIPARLSLDTAVSLRRGSVLLITYDGVRHALVARTGSE